jgi:SpoVK/Ycf46/Vps4 family AAA+-type ATPase
LAQHIRRQQAAAPGLALVTPHGGWDRVGGLDNLKRWADQRRLALNPDSSLPFARGVLLYGIPGTGKSVSVRAWADDWRLPLLRLDWGGLMGRYVGDSERRLANALAAAERLSPVILWLDEIDKAFGGIQRDEDSGVSRRLVGTLLTWMQEHQQPVLLLATANDVTGLPAELLRPGRFDALFFVDLPGPAARRDIMAIHLAARFIPPDPAMLALAETLDQYSGADIAAVVQEAQFLAAQEGTSVTAEVLAHSAHTVIPWAKTLGEELESRRQWAKGRLRLA